MEDQSEHSGQKSQLRRLETLTDVVYALVLWRLFTFMPQPTEAIHSWRQFEELVVEESSAFLLMFIGLVFTIIYWLQSNKVFANLERTDGKHTILAILELFSLLLFLYAIRIGIQLEPSAGTRAFESATASIMGILSGLSWSYAMKNRRLVKDSVTPVAAKKISVSLSAAPIAALITIPFAFIDPILWEISWLAVILITPLLSRKFKEVPRIGKSK